MNKFKNFISDLNKTKLICSLILGIGAAFLIYYFFLPPINLRAVGFWAYVTAIIIAFSIPYLNLKVNVVEYRERRSKYSKAKTKITANKFWVILIAIPIIVIVLGNFISSTVFSAMSTQSL
jgi:heme/copper-type cytochrome/quinol oxidase subunit 2